MARVVVLVVVVRVVNRTNLEVLSLYCCNYEDYGVCVWEMVREAYVFGAPMPQRAMAGFWGADRGETGKETS